MGESNHHQEAKSGRRVLYAAIVVLLTCCVLLQYQVMRRNDRLDDLESQGDRIEQQIDALQAQTSRVKEIAEDFAKGDPEAAAALQEIFAKIDSIYQAVVVEGKS